MPAQLCQLETGPGGKDCCKLNDIVRLWDRQKDTTLKSEVGFLIKSVIFTKINLKQERRKFHENQVFQQLQQLKIWIRGDN